MATIRTASEFRAAMKRREGRIRRAAVAGLDEATRLIADEVRNLTPKDTGDLADTVEAGRVSARGEVLSAEVTIGAGMDSPHVASVEYGNAHMVAEPFIRPGFRQARDRARRLVFGRIADALD